MQCTSAVNIQRIDLNALLFTENLYDFHIFDRIMQGIVLYGVMLVDINRTVFAQLKTFADVVLSDGNVQQGLFDGVRWANVSEPFDTPQAIKVMYSFLRS